MRLELTVVAMLLCSATVARAQATPRFSMGPVVLVDRLYFEGGARGSVPIAGVVAHAAWTKRIGVEAELTFGSRSTERSYEGRFISYAPGPHPSLEDFEEFAPVARRMIRYTPGFGGGAAVVVSGQPHRRVALSGRAGLSGRSYQQSSEYTVLSIPEGVDPERVGRDFAPETLRRSRGGLLLGLDVAIAVTSSLSLAPEVRVVYSGPAQVGNTYRELGFGARGLWRF